MPDTLITAFQIFAIGFSFNIAGPCFLSCTPLIATYIIATKKNWQFILRDIVIFSAGRLLAYAVLGYLAGLSSAVLQKFIASPKLMFLRPMAGVISIILAVLVLTFKEDSLNCSLTKKAAGFSNVFILGFIMGIIPCFPLVILLGEIALISKSALAGAFYAFFFGLGTFFASLILLGAFCGISSKITTRFIKSKKANLIFRVICALFLIAFGLMLIYHRQ